MSQLPKPPDSCPLCGGVWGAPFQGDAGNPYCFHDRMAWSEMEDFHAPGSGKLMEFIGGELPPHAAFLQWLKRINPELAKMLEDDEPDERSNGEGA